MFVSGITVVILQNGSSGRYFSSLLTYLSTEAVWMTLRKYRDCILPTEVSGYGSSLTPDFTGRKGEVTEGFLWSLCCGMCFRTRLRHRYKIFVDALNNLAEIRCGQLLGCTCKSSISSHPLLWKSHSNEESNWLNAANIRSPAPLEDHSANSLQVWKSQQRSKT